MKFNQIGRRQIFGLVGGLTAVLFGRRSSAVGSSGSAISFYVAGTRFQSPVSDLRVGAPLNIVPQLFEGNLSYAVETVVGQRIGYVPVKKVSVVRDSGTQNAWLSAANYETVPWKRFRVTIPWTNQAVAS
jgi:hypothetical protein